ncbi:S-layer homology domain-containing protein [Desulfofundulus australicus DSM 11792]|uniref:S-layer homology domain-containing protein n=1 Tax=Desulfofundulus australicus DSM 11792 TaxID=1121425 RepID=A0A1M4Z199_9FIRM|nr:S-layer homology domain-containing protein [Desulfofundulus australicus]SHF11853.1 S-layer homology domain-containing protein [Desulfofundulus australicus DSM 11792]
MSCRKLPVFLLAAVVIFICGWFSTRMASAGEGTFNDIQGHWAERVILEMNAYDIVHGYPGGEFRPNNKVTMLEAVVMILNTLGWGEEAGQADLSGLQFHPSVTWGREYLALAVEKGMLTRAGLPQIDSQRLASRVEVAALVCLALGLTPDASQVTFFDTGDIPEKYRGYVGAVVKQGIIQGMPGNMFMPGEPVTRAQLCAILSRLIDRKLIPPPPPMELVVGRITSMDMIKGTVLLRNLEGEKTVLLPADITILTASGTTGPEFLKTGDRLKCIVDVRNNVRYAVLMEDASIANSVEGLVVSFSRDGSDYKLTLETNDGDYLTCPVEDDARLFRAGSEINTCRPVENDYVQAGLDVNGRVVRIDIYPPERISGTVVEVGGASLTLRRQGEEEEYAVSPRVQVTRNYVRGMNFSELRRGDRVEAVVMKRTIFQVNLLSDVLTGQSGMVSRVHSKAIYLYVGDEEKRYELDEQVEVIRDGRLIDVRDLRRGDYVNFEVDGRGYVITIEVLDEDEGEFEGTVKYLDIYPTPWLTIALPGGLEMEYEVSGKVDVLRDGDRINLSDIIPGSQVAVRVEDGKVTEIEVLDDQNLTVQCLVSGVNPERRRITLEINDRYFTYFLAPGAAILDRNGKPVSLEDLEGYRVEVRLKDGEVDRLTIL